MNGGISEGGNSIPVQQRAVAFVTNKPVVWVFFVQLEHEVIPRGFGEDGSAGDAQRALVAFDEGGLGDIQFGEFESEIGEEELREERKHFQCAARGETGGWYDSHLVYFLR